MSLRYRSGSGVETILAGLTPGGDLEYGAVATRSGTATITAPSTIGAKVDTTITFTDPMPDGDFIVTFAHNELVDVFEMTPGRSANGFIFRTITLSTGAAGQSVQVNWKAFKLYEVQHAEQNAEDIANIKSMIPANASAANKLATSGDVTSLSTEVDGRLDDLEDVVPTSASITNKLVDADSLDTALAGKQDTLTFDTTPTTGSNNPVTSDGIKAAIDAIPSNPVDAVTNNDMHAVTSNAVYDKLYNNFRDSQVFYSPRDYYSIQADFTWTNAKVQALVDDMISAFGNGTYRGFCNIQNGITFVGTYIYIHDSSYTHISLDIKSYDNSGRYHIVINPTDGIVINKITSITYVDITAAGNATGYANYPTGYNFNNTVIVSVMHNNGAYEKAYAPYADIETNVGLHTDAIFLWNRGDSERTVRVFLSQI